jgi:hypothetical protein
MPAPFAIQNIQEAPLKIVGGCNFGRYNKISDEQTWNFIVSDGFLVPYAGYSVASIISPSAVGRGLYTSLRGNLMIAVIGAVVYKITLNTVTNQLQSVAIVNGILPTLDGDVYISENNNAQICITDNSYVYVYNWSTNIFYSSQVGAVNYFPFQYPNPGYVSFQNGRLIIACNETQYWLLSALNDALSWPANPPTVADASQVGIISSKPTHIVAAIPVPGGGNNLFVMGENTAESWQDIGYTLFPYQRNQSFNADYGCLNARSIASLDNMIVWIGVNEQTGPVLMVAVGNTIKKISTDGINYKLANLTNPGDCTGFLFQQDGHIIYQFTFPSDNISFAYDFNTNLFFYVTDENLNYHIAREVVFFNNKYYFVSLNGGSVYEFGTQYTYASYALNNAEIYQIPRVRITPPLRLPNQRYFVAKSLGFTLENGLINEQLIQSIIYNQNNLATETFVVITTEAGNPIAAEAPATTITTVTNTTYSEAVDLSISRDGGVAFGASWRKNMNPTGYRKSRFIYQRLGIVNDASFQLRFNGFGRFVATDGVVEIYQ